MDRKLHHLEVVIDRVVEDGLPTDDKQLKPLTVVNIEISQNLWFPRKEKAGCTLFSGQIIKHFRTISGVRR